MTHPSVCLFACVCALSDLAGSGCPSMVTGFALILVPVLWLGFGFCLFLGSFSSFCFAFGIVAFGSVILVLRWPLVSLWALGVMSGCTF